MSKSDKSKKIPAIESSSSEEEKAVSTKKKITSKSDSSSDSEEVEKKETKKEAAKKESPPKKKTAVAKPKSKAKESPVRKPFKKDASESGSDSEASHDSEKNSKHNAKMEKIIRDRIKKYRDIAKKQEFVVPAEIPLHKMESRFEWLNDEIEDQGGIIFKPSNKKADSKRFRLIGVDKSMKLHFFYEGSPEKDFQTPTECLREIYANVGIETKSIKGWDQSCGYVVRKDGLTRDWLVSSAIIPPNYRSRKRVRAEEKPASKSKSEEAPRKKLKKGKHERALKDDVTAESLFKLEKSDSEDIAVRLNRLSIIRGAVSLDARIVQQLFSKMGELVAESVADPHATEEEIETEPIEQSKNDENIVSNDDPDEELTKVVSKKNAQEEDMIDSDMI